MGFLYLLLVVIAITATALIAKLASRNNVTALDLSTSLFAVSAVLGALVLYPRLPVKLTATDIVLSTVAGVGGAVAVLAFNVAIRAGHFGFSNSIYRSSFLFPVVYSILFLNVAIKAATVVGITLILVAIFLMSSGSFGKGKKDELRWFLLIMLAFVMSGVPRLGQTLTSASGGNYYLYLFLSYLAGAAVLGIVTLAKRTFNPASLTWGAGAAVSSYIGVFCTLKSLDTLTPHIVFPISLSGPIIMGILLSLLLFREKISPSGWGGVVLGVAGITILAIWK
jgi:drug/metabolite transporter (DMT)-like permease